MYSEQFIAIEAISRHQPTIVFNLYNPSFYINKTIKSDYVTCTLCVNIA